MTAMVTHHMRHSNYYHSHYNFDLTSRMPAIHHSGFHFQHEALFLFFQIYNIVYSESEYVLMYIHFPLSVPLLQVLFRHSNPNQKINLQCKRYSCYPYSAVIHYFPIHCYHVQYHNSIHLYPVPDQQSD